MTRRMTGWTLLAVLAVVVSIVGCRPTKRELQEQLAAKDAELAACNEALAKCEHPDLPPSPIDVEPGGGGVLVWRQNGLELEAGGSLQIRDDFSWKVDYLKVKVGTEWKGAKWLKFNLVVGNAIKPMEISAGGGVFQWRLANVPLAICDHLPDTDPNQDPELPACGGGGIAAELYGNLNGNMTAELTDGTTTTVTGARLAPR